MGSLTSSPDLPAPQPRQTVIQQPASQPESGGGYNSPEDSATDKDNGTDDQNQSGTGADTGGPVEGEQQRAAALLRERRGRESTINTGFRGILEPRESQPRRKTLLGG